VSAVVIVGFAAAQTPSAFQARLGWVPVSLAELGLVGGGGAVTAELDGSRLVISGSFDGLPAAATGARLHRGVATGASGPAIAELDVDGTTGGALRGNVTLNRAERNALLAGLLYVQLYAESGVPPDNAVLRGWLLAPSSTR
jgi:hypothetical protein